MGTIVIAKFAILLTISYFYHSEQSVIQYFGGDVSLNKRPIIGVLSQESSDYLRSKFPEPNNKSYIAASYVKAIEASGARVVPILIGNECRCYYKDIMSKINGIVFPGGSSDFNNSNGYAEAGRHIYEIAKEMNDAGDYFPLFGTCLGFQFLVVVDSGTNYDPRISCNSFDCRPLEFCQDYRRSKMFRNAPNEILRLLAEKNTTNNAHHFCILDENLAVGHNWTITSHAYDESGLKFISSIEHKKYPFHGVQFHPEKSSYEWNAKRRYAHTAEAVFANRYFMDFFVEECRKSTHTFDNKPEENSHLIYNYNPIYTGSKGSMFEQCYLFDIST